MQAERREKLERISLYKNNVVGYGISLLSVLSELAYSVAILDVMVPDIRMFFVVMVNLCLLFCIFYIAVLEKVYRSAAAYSAFIVVGYLLGRMFWIVPRFLRPAARSQFLFAMDACTALLLLFAAVRTIDVSSRRKKHLVHGEGL
jgi:hypothetical protein